MDLPAPSGSSGRGSAGGSVKFGVPSAGKLNESRDSFCRNNCEASALLSNMLLSTTLKHDIKPNINLVREYNNFLIKTNLRMGLLECPQPYKRQIPVSTVPGSRYQSYYSPLPGLGAV